MNLQKWQMDLAGRKLEIETGFLATQANGSVKVKYGDTVVLATAVMNKSTFGSGYFPLMVEYEERFYASGKIKGSRFMKREGRPTDEAILTARLIDRTIRPLFDQNIRNEVQVVVTVLSIDQANDPDIVSIIAASAALHISDIPWAGPIAAVRAGKKQDKLVINPLNEDLEESDLDLTVSGSKDKINMIESGAKEVSEDIIVKAFSMAQQSIAQIVDFQYKIRKEVGKEKREAKKVEWDEEFEKKIKAILEKEKYAEILYETTDKAVKYEKLDNLRGKIKTFLAETYPDEANQKWEAAEGVMDEIANDIVHKNILEKDLRPDGRKLDEVRNLDCQISVLPRTHGSATFTRGETQAISIVTLAAPGMEQLIDSMEETDVKKRYMHHYNFPPYCVGEVKPMRGPGRREIGHGALAERALEAVIPPKEKFPYTLRVVSEILSSNGSSSMASVCGSTLSLMDAGVPIKSPVSGIAMGLIVGKDGQFKVLSDIQGLEDHHGDIDCKVAGTEKGITALQMDVKVDGVTVSMLEAVLAQAKKSRLHILEAIKKAISEPRPELSQYAPRVVTIQIDPDKIREVIGPGGKVINKIIEETGVEIDIEDDGQVFITSTDAEGSKKAVKWVNDLTREVKPGEIFNGKITRIMNFGAFAEILPGQEGLIHISELADYRVNKVEDIVSMGDVVPVKVKEIDDQGRINLSLKDAARVMK